jgi:hypothetical protein
VRRAIIIAGVIVAALAMGFVARAVWTHGDRGPPYEAACQEYAEQLRPDVQLDWGRAAWAVHQSPTGVGGQSQVLVAAERVPTADGGHLTVACIESLDGDVLSGNVGK